MNERNTHPTPQSEAVGQQQACSAFEKCRHTNSTVNQMLRGGASLEDVIVALCGQNEAMLKRLIEVESYAPKKIKADDGKVYIWHCPDELIPMQNDQGLATQPAPQMPEKHK